MMILADYVIFDLNRNQIFNMNIFTVKQGNNCVADQNSIKWYFILLVIYTVFLQLPLLRIASISQVLLYIFWGAALLICVARGSLLVNAELARIFSAYACIIVYALLLGQITSYDYISSPLVRNLSISVYILSVGYFLSLILSREALLAICKYFALAVLITMPYYYFNYFSTTTYFNSKNSLGPIIVFALIIFATLPYSANKLVKYFRLFAIAALTYSVLLSSNRASMVSIAVLLLYGLLMYAKKYKLILFLLIIIIATICVTNIQIYGFLLHITMIDRLGLDPNSLSRGRTFQLDQAWKIIVANPFWGIGHYYVENFHLSALVQFGVIGSLPIFMYYFITVKTFVLNFRNSFQSVPLNRTIALMALHGVVISLFEEQAPFGPGTSYCILWFLVGFYIGRRRELSISKPTACSEE